MTIEFIKSEDFRFQFNKSGKTPLVRLLGMSRMLKNWNQQRLEKYSNSAMAGISLEEVNILKVLISTEVVKLKLDNAEVVTDQILFLIIGAIKLHMQNKSDKPWELVNQSVRSFLKPKKTLPPSLYILIFSTLMVTFGMITTLVNTQKKEASLKMLDSYNNPLNDASISEVGNATLSNLQVIYKRMQIGDCQLPQAAMLQPVEQEAYITFVNNGTVDLNNADNLKNALGHVNCLYSLKMMPQP